MDDAQEQQYLVSHYHPNSKILESIAGVRLIAVVGPSAVGKTTIMETAVQKSPLLSMVGGVTSRARREGESEAEFKFLTKEQVLTGAKQGYYVQIAMTPSGDLYATSPSDYPAAKVGIMAVLSSAIADFRKYFPELKVVFIVPGTYEAWVQRFNERAADDEDKSKRLEEAKQSLSFALTDENVHFILNDGLEQAVDRLIQVAEGAKPDAEDQAKTLAAQYLESLNGQKP